MAAVYDLAQLAENKMPFSGQKNALLRATHLFPKEFEIWTNLLWQLFLVISTSYCYFSKGGGGGVGSENFYNIGTNTS